ncbi:MAG: MazG family protein [Aquihabitans sp.]
MTRPGIVIIGLGPGDPSLITAGALQAIERVPVRYLRTAIHPSAHLVTDAVTFDHRYDAADTFDDVYGSIVDDLLAAATEHGEILYAVPGSPRVLERTVDLLAQAEVKGLVDLEVHAGLSFVDLAWVRLGIDPFEDGVRLIDAHQFDTAAAGERGPLLVAHCHNRRVLSDVKLAVDDAPTEPVVVLQRLGLPDESVTTVAWEDLDRSFEPDHLTSIFVPTLASPVAAEMQAFVALVATLRAECPWDAEQTHRTLTRHLLEETYEVLEALDEVGDGGPDTDADHYSHLEEELGDLLFQIVFHTTLATEAGAFDMADVARGVHDKLVHRHPHVFPRVANGLVDVAGSDDVLTNWEQIKKAEKGRDSVFDGIPAALPALLYATKVLKKAATVGLDADRGIPTLGEAVTAVNLSADEDAFGRLLLSVVDSARAVNVDPEAALRAAATALRLRAQAIESESSETQA